jgi:hypothetical protein
MLQHNVIKFVGNLRQVGVFCPGTLVSSPNKTDRHDITELLLKVTQSTINPTQYSPKMKVKLLFVYRT